MFAAPLAFDGAKRMRGVGQLPGARVGRYGHIRTLQYGQFLSTESKQCLLKMMVSMAVKVRQ
jgi:hypothetical protein